MNPIKLHFLLLVLLIGGCASAPATRFYTLAPVTGEAVPLAPRTIIVQEVALPRYLDRPQIVTRTGAHRLHFAEFAHWGGDLREDVTRVLAGNLAQRLPGSAVLPAPTFASAPADLRIEVEILHFEAADDQVHLAARWRSDPARAPQEVRFTRPQPGKTVDAALVATMSALLGDLAQAIAGQLPAGGR